MRVALSILIALGLLAGCGGGSATVLPPDPGDDFHWGQAYAAVEAEATAQNGPPSVALVARLDYTTTIATFPCTLRFHFAQGALSGVDYLFWKTNHQDAEAFRDDYYALSERLEAQYGPPVGDPSIITTPGQLVRQWRPAGAEISLLYDVAFLAESYLTLIYRPRV